MSEQWLPIVGFGNYEVSDRGRIRNVKTGKILKSSVDRKTNGYHVVTLVNNGIRYNRRVHQAVLTAFIGRCPSGCVANHKDSNSTNNLLENLEWTTQSNNVCQAFATGRAIGPSGEKNGQSRLRAGEVWLIRRLRNLGAKGYLVAKMFRIAQPTVSMIIHNRRWENAK